MSETTREAENRLLEKHIASGRDLYGKIWHSIEGAAYPLLVIHNEDKLEECRMCQALGIEKSSYKAD